MGHDYLKAGLIGIAAGLAASLAMELAQQALTRLTEDNNSGGDSDDEEPATAKAARAVAGTSGHELDKDAARAGGRLVHYATGTALGLAYALAAERDPRIGRAAGLPLALGTMLVVDEIAVPAIGLGDPPTEAPASSHLLSLASHLVFGMVAEGVRRALGGRSPG